MVNRCFTVSGTEIKISKEHWRAELGKTKGNVLELGAMGRGKRNQPGAPELLELLDGRVVRFFQVPDSVGHRPWFQLR